MTSQEMVDLVKDRSKQPDAAKILRELRSAFRWATNRVYLTEGGPDLLSTIGSELTISGTTRTYDIAAFVSGNLLGLKELWLKLPTGDQVFTPMVECDATHPAFQANDEQVAADPLIASGHPVLYHIQNFSQVRFAPALPDGSILRVDYYKFGAPPDPTSNPTPSVVGTDLNALFHDAIVNKATAHCLENLDDDRTGAWETRARDVLNDALYAAQKRKTGPKAHRGWLTRGR